MPMPMEDWSSEEEHAMTVGLPEWDYAADVVGLALRDRLHGTAKLEPTINDVFGYDRREPLVLLDQSTNRRQED
jgi:hypothetical protein